MREVLQHGVLEEPYGLVLVGNKHGTHIAKIQR
jgi:hypothetical protein